MSRRLVRAVLPLLALTATTTGAQGRPTTVVSANAAATAHDGSLGAATLFDLDFRAPADALDADAPTAARAILATQNSFDAGVPGSALGNSYAPPLDASVQSAHARASAGPGHTAAVKASKVARLPEPATWAMMIIGFGVIGGAVRRGLRKSDERFNDYIRSITDNADA